MAPSIWSSGTTSSASVVAVAWRSPFEAVAETVGREADRERVGARDTEPGRRIGPADEHRLTGAARDRPLDDADHAQAEGVAGRGRDRHDVAERETEPLGQGDRDDRRAAGVEGREGRRPVARGEGEPPVGVEIRADDRRGIRPAALDGDVEGADRADPGDTRHRVAEVVGDALVGRDRSDGGQQEVARDHVVDPAGGGRACVLADAAERDDHGQADGQGAEGQRGPAAIAHDRAARETLFDAHDERERDARDAGHRRQEERDEQRRAEQDGVDRQALDDGGAAGGARQDHDTDDGDDREDDGQPAQSRGAGRARIEMRPERLDRLDAARPAGRFDGGREGHPDADEQGQDDALDRHDRSLEADRPDGAHGRHDGRGEDEADGHAHDRADDAQDERLAEHEGHDLATAGARGAQEADLADPFRDGHRQRVEDQERAREQGDGGDERGGHREVGRGGAQGRRDVGGGRQDVRLGGEAGLEGGLGRAPAGAVGQPDVDARDGRAAEHGLRGPQRDDHRPPVGVGDGSVAGDDPDDPVGDCSRRCPRW